jgi:hypothetical protein
MTIGRNRFIVSQARGGRPMRVQRVAMALTAINLILLVALLGQRVRPAVADGVKSKGEGVAAVLRGRALEIVDEQNRVRAMIAVMPPSRVDGKDYPETVLLRLVDPKSGPLVKISAAVDGSGLMLTDDTDRGVLAYARDGSSVVKVQGEEGRAAVLKP